MHPWGGGGAGEGGGECTTHQSELGARQGHSVCSRRLARPSEHRTASQTMAIGLAMGYRVNMNSRTSGTERAPILSACLGTQRAGGAGGGGDAARGGAGGLYPQGGIRKGGGGLKRGRGVWLGHPSSQGPPMVPAKGGPIILLPSARHLEERLTVSQSVSQSGKQSVRQAVNRASRQADRQAETHSLAFFQSWTTSSNSGEPQ